MAGFSNYGGVSRSGYRANAVGSGRRAVSESAPRVGGFAVRGKPPALEPLLSVHPPPVFPMPSSPPCSAPPDFLVNFPPESNSRKRFFDEGRVMRRNLGD